MAGRLFASSGQRLAQNGLWSEPISKYGDAERFPPLPTNRWFGVQALACRERSDSLKAGLQTTTGSWEGVE
jgi:hypothetical protein